MWYCVENATTTSERSLTEARGALVARKTRGNHDEGDDDKHQKSVMGGGVEGAPLAVFGGAKFMQRVFNSIEQVMRNTVQTIQMPVRVADSRATTAMKAFLQLRSPTIKANRIR